MNKAFDYFVWENYSSKNTPLSERFLNRINSALETIDTRVVTFDTTKASKIEISTLFKEVSYNEQTGIITFTRKNGSTVTIDTPMEKIQTGIYYNPDTEMLVLPLIDGTSMEVDLSRLMQFDEFIDSDTIAFSVKANGTVTAIVKEGSIEEKHLRPNYLAEIKVEAVKAEKSAIKSESYAHGGTGTRAGEDTDNAEYYSEKSKEYADSWKGSLLPQGAIAFSQLPTSGNVAGHLYNIMDAFVSDDRFKDGVGYSYPAETNVYWTSDGKWDCLSGILTKEVTQAEYDALSTAEKLNGTIYYISDADNSMSVDNQLSTTSINPVQNKVITQALNQEINRAKTAEAQGKSYTDTKIADLINGAPSTLDTLGEISDAMQNNQSVVDSLESAIGNKVDKVTGKGLSTNDFTTPEKTKLSGIQSGAEANVQADWDINDIASDAYIKNKPTIPAKINSGEQVIIHSNNTVDLKEYGKTIYDWNAAVYNGFYQSIHTDSQPVLNRPDNNVAHFGFVIAGVTRIYKIMQYIWSIDSNNAVRMYVRNCSIPTGETGWSEWSKFVEPKGGAGKYIQSISETDGKISAVEADIPAIPSVGNGTVTIKQAGTQKGTFTMNQSGNTTIELTDNNTTYGPATTSSSGLLTSTDKVKLDGISSNANNYSLPAASSTVRGGVKTGYTQNGKNYPVQLSNEQMYVNVPWTDTNTDTNTWKANTKDSEGYVAKGSGQANKVWKTDENGNPAWRDENESAVSGVKGNKETEYRTGNVNLTAENIGALPTAGGTVNGLLTTAGGTRVAHETGQLGTEGFINFATITTKKSSYANHPIIFNISGRGRQGSMKVTVVFHNNNSGKPDVNIFTQEGDCSYPVYMAVDATNTTYNKYKLYVRKSEAYGDVSVFASHDCSDGAFDIIYPNEQVLQLPSRCVTAKTGGKVKESDTAITLFGGEGTVDLRNEPTTPNDYNNMFKSSGIKTKDAIGVTDGSTLTQIIGYRAWGNSTGGKAHELGFTGNGNLYHRAGSATTWENWREIAHTDNVPQKTSELKNDSDYLQHKSVTQEEYDRLSEEEKMNGTIYFIN